jgi:hypothetical protein
MLALLTALLSTGVASTRVLGSYDLRGVKGIQSFQGSTAARALLAKNGFVVTEPAFRQIFEPYIKSP